MKPLTSIIITVIVAGLIIAAAVRVLGLAEERDTVTVVHWTNGHLMREGLLPDMAQRFNREEHRTASGKLIKVKLYRRDSWIQADDLLSRVYRGIPMESQFPDPTVLTTSADHWLVSINERARIEMGRNLIDLGESVPIAHTWVGIVTYEDMARCLGWPAKEIGYADIIALRNDPEGWASKGSCAKPAWGKKPLVAYTDPTTSSTGRSVLFSLYGIAAGKPMEQLTVSDVNNPQVVAFVRQFNKDVIDHYMNTSLIMNTRVQRGPRDGGHFFLMPEDNLFHLYKGGETVVDQFTGLEVKAPPISGMVMIYPKEGSALHNHSASFVDAPWVTPEHRRATEEWIDYLLTADNQRAFMAAGFRPGTDLALTEPISARYGMDPNKPVVKLNPDRVNQGAAAAIMASWDEVKKPSMVSFVVDTSGSMEGGKLRQAKDGLLRALDSMAQNNYAGLITFGNDVRFVVPMGPLASNKFTIGDSVESLQARGGTALYDAIKAGIEMADRADGPAGSIRAVVVLTDGKANTGLVRLDNLVQLTSRSEAPVLQFAGFENDEYARDLEGRQVPKSDLTALGPAIKTEHSVQVFFVGIGDADMQIGRLVAQATGAEFQGATEKDLATVLELISKYF